MVVIDVFQDLNGNILYFYVSCYILLCFANSKLESPIVITTK